MTSGFRGRTEIPRAVAIVLATLIALPLAESLYQVPVQVSDSLEPIVIASTASSVGQLLSDAPRFSPTTLRPMRYVQARWLLNSVEATGLSYRAVFRGVHVALLMLLVALFVISVRVRTWTDLAAFTIAFPVLIGIHTFAAMLFEAFPVNHYAEVGVCALGVFVLAGITDGLDGLLARLADQSTSIGAWLDPMADKLLLVSTFVVLTWPGGGKKAADHSTAQPTRSSTSAPATPSDGFSITPPVPPSVSPLHQTWSPYPRHTKSPRPGGPNPTYSPPGRPPGGDKRDEMWQ